MGVYEGGAYATTSTGGGGGGAPAWGEIEGALPNQSDLQAALDGKIDIDGLNSEISNLNFSPVTAPAYGEGKLWYDNNTKTLSLYDDHAGTSIQLGKESVIDARNDTGDTIANGQAVFVSGAIGQHPTIALAISDSESTSLCIGLATHDIADNTVGKVTVLGTVNDLDTSDFTDGAALYLSETAPGGFTDIPPEPPGFSVLVGYVTHSHVTQGQILVSPRQTNSNSATRMDVVNWAFEQGTLNTQPNTINLIDPTGGAVTVNVPEGYENARVTVTDATGTSFLNSITINLNSNFGSSFVVNYALQSITFAWSVSANWWVFESTSIVPRWGDLLGNPSDSSTLLSLLNSSQIPGYRLIKTTTLTTGTAATFTPDSRTTALLVEIIGATGGGGAADGQGVATVAIGAAGGEGGSLSVFLVISPEEIFNYTIGAAGIAGVVPSGNGGAGGTTSFVGSVSGTHQVTGSLGGDGSIGSTTGTAIGGAGGVASGTNATIRNGNRILPPRWVSGVVYFPSNNQGFYGGDFTYGSETAGASSTRLGVPGRGGVSIGVTTNYAGGAGFRGEIKVSEYTGGV